MTLLVTVGRVGLGIVDWFVPEAAKLDPERRRRSNLTVISALGLGSVAIPLLFLNYQMVGHVGPTVVTFIVSIFVLGALALLLRAGVPQRWIGALVSIDLLFALSFMTYFNGGIHAASVMWLIPMPLVGQILLGRSFGLLCAGFTVLELVAFYVADQLGVTFSQELTPLKMLTWHWIGACTSVSFVAGLGWYFEQERQRAEQTTRASDERLRMVVANADVMLLALDGEGVIRLAVGKRFDEGGTESAPLVGTSIFDMFPATDTTCFREALTGTSVTFESSLQNRFLETSLAPVLDDAGTQVGVTCLSIDVTERKRMEDSVALTDRMASLGILAAGVGHEINNPLTYILGSIEFALGELASDGETDSETLASVLLDAKGGAERVQDIVTDLRLFARPSSELAAEVDIRAVIGRAITMASHEISHRARLVTEFAETPLVVGTEGQFGQVILNLLVNAAQAIPPGAYDDNQISIRTFCRGQREVVIEVKDTGEGLSPEVMSRVFEPFFTTKSATGTGLGLSISHRIVEAMGGDMEVESQPLGGTLFRVVLPAAEGCSMPSVSEEPVVKAATPSVADILVVDDQEALLRLLTRMLEPHNVVAASSGREALEFIEKQHFDLVLCDLMMPDMTGIDVHEQLSRDSPEIATRMAFMTGGAFTEGAEKFLQEHDKAYLSKPFSAAGLRAFVAARLDRPV